MRILQRGVNTPPTSRSSGPAYGSQTEDSFPGRTDSVVPVACISYGMLLLVTIKHLLPVLAFDITDTFATVDHFVLLFVLSAGHHWHCFRYPTGRSVRVPRQRQLSAALHWRPPRIRAGAAALCTMPIMMDHHPQRNPAKPELLDSRF